MQSEKPAAEEYRHPEWIWYCESTTGPMVTFGRWAKNPQQKRYKLAEIQATEHDHPEPSALPAAEPVRWMWEERRYAESDIWDDMYDDEPPAPHKYVRNIRPLYAAPPAPSVVVKELEWSPRNDQPQYEVCADTPFGRYKTSNKGEYGFGWMQPRQTVWSGFLPTLEEAKAAAQADFETRIRSALSAQVKDVARWQLVPKDDESRCVADSALPHEMIEAGILVQEQVNDDHCNYVAGETTDWDCGMVAVAIYRAMLAAAPAKQEGGHD